MRLLLVSALLLVGCSSGGPDQRRRPLDRDHQDARCAEPIDIYGLEPDGGVVSSESIAVDVAHAYLKAIYPDDRNLRPMKASVSNGVWTVTGTLPKNMVGGVAGVALCQSNGRVLGISHGK